MSKGQLILVTGPSGVGKRTLIEYVRGLKSFPLCELSVSLTTRKPRSGEENGKDYHFISREEFVREVEAGRMLEYAEYAGNFYGTPKCAIEARRTLGVHVILEIEVQGAMQVMAKMPEAYSFFILPPEPRIETLRERLLARGTESVERIERRLTIAAQEMPLADRFRYRIENKDLELAQRTFATTLKFCLIKAA